MVSKKGALLGIGLTLLGTGASQAGNVKATINETNENVKNVISAPIPNGNSKANSSNTQVMSPKDFDQQKENKDSIRNQTLIKILLTKTLGEMSHEVKSINTFYGKDTVAQKINDLIVNNPDFINLSEQQQLDILKGSFPEYVKAMKKQDIAILVGFLAVIFFLVQRYRHTAGRHGH